MESNCCFQNPYKKVGYVIFDLDGTLIDSEIIYDKIFEDFLAEYDKVMDIDTITKIRGSTLENCLIYIKNHFNIKTSVEDLTIKFREMTTGKLEQMPLTKGAEALVKHLSNNKVPLAIATSSRRQEFDQKTSQHHELFSLFHHIVCGDDPDVYKGKPNPCIYLVAAQRFPQNPNPDECLVFEDSVNGMNAGLRAGMQVVIVPAPTVSYFDWKNATIRINSLEDTPLELFGLKPLRVLKDNSCFNMISEVNQGEPNEVEEVESEKDD